MQTSRLIAATSVACALALVAACSDDTGSSSSHSASLPLLDPKASGDIAAKGGATRAGDDRAKLIADSLKNSTAKNVILLIGDGMGDSEITAARNYEHGAGGAFPGLDALPLTGQYTHYSVAKNGKPTYVTDSAASGTAWATGNKTYNGAIGVNNKGNAQKSLLELAKSAGKATGDITTAEIQDATPAVQVAHVSGRKCYGPEVTSQKCPENALEKGGKGSITEQMLALKPDLIMGGGTKTFAEKAKAGDYKDKTLAEQAKARGFQTVTTADELNAVSEATQNKPVLGLFADGNLPTRWSGPTATREGYLAPAVTCADNPKHSQSLPKLAAMTKKSIDLLKGNDKGFFLQVEGASIDKQDHAADPCGQIGETVDLDEATKVALDYAKDNKDTLVIVTADHAHTSQIAETMSPEEVEDTAKEAKKPVEDVRKIIYPGLTTVLKTKEGANMTISYGTSTDVEVAAEGHTGTQLRIAGYGPGAANVVGLTDQTDLFFTISRALKLGTS